MQKLITKNKTCRACTGKHFHKVLDFGKTPLANAFLKKQQLTQSELSYPLVVYKCDKCNLLQLRDVVSPQILFKDYVYFSSTSNSFINHFKKLAQSTKQRFKFKNNSLIVDIGSNDGILLKPFQQIGMRVLGIEPAKNIAQIANNQGITTISEFFNETLAKNIKEKYGLASFITATNVFAHINDLDEVLKGVKLLLHPQGVFVIEVPYLVDFLEKNLFDTVYHEHLSYFSLRPLITLFERLHMKLFRIEKVPTHGGSIRVFIAQNSNQRKIDRSVGKFLHFEKKYRLHSQETYKSFAKRILQNKLQLLKLLKKLKKQKKHIAGYGAPAKGNTLLNHFGINSNLLDFIVDDSKPKQGLYTPGTHIPVVDSKKLFTKKTDYLLILAWNFADSIMKSNQRFKKIGGKFILPVPIPKII